MTKLDYFWLSNRDWYEYKGLKRVLKPSAPKEAKESYERYLKQLKEHKRAI
ncbi:MAG: hypothetical protein KHZ87_08125 [Clostridiales bacterium]|nr:hypothetical protein [Clostridiales bacterium]